jgi:hypothetical protein
MTDLVPMETLRAPAPAAGTVNPPEDARSAVRKAAMSDIPALLHLIITTPGRESCCPGPSLKWPRISAILS